MTDQKNSPEAVLEAMINRNVKLQFLEYLCAAGSAAGTVAILFQQSAVYAAAPLTLSVCLNLWNRRELDQLTRQRTFADATEIKRSLAAEIQSLRTDFDALPAAGNNSEDLQMSLASLSDRVSALDLQVQQPAELSGEPLGALEQDVAQLKYHHIELAQSLDDVKQQFGSGSEEDAVSPELAQEVVALKDAIAALEARPVPPETVVPNLEPVRAELQAMLTPVQSQVSVLSDKLGMGDFDANYQPVDANQVNSQFEGINTRFEGINTQFEGINTKVDSILTNVSDEMNVFRGNLESTQGQIQTLQTQVGSVQEAAQAAGPGEELDLKIQGALTPIKDHLNGLEARVNEMGSADPAAVQGQTEQLQAVQTQLHEVDGRLNQVSQQVSTEMANLPQLVAEQVKNQVAAIPTPAPVAKPAEREAQVTDVQALDDLLAGLES